MEVTKLEGYDLKKVEGLLSQLLIIFVLTELREQRFSNLENKFTIHNLRTSGDEKMGPMHVQTV